MKSIILTTLLLITITAFTQDPTFKWARQMGGESGEGALAIASDDSGNVYTIGTFADTVDFDPGPSVFNLFPKGVDVFISKLDANGHLVWAKNIGGNYNEQGYSIAIDKGGNLYVLGTFNSSACDFNPDPLATFTMNTVGYTDIFILKLDASGNFEWAKQLGGSGYDLGTCLTLDDLGNIFLTGYFWGTADFNPGPEVSNLTSISGKEDMFIAKLDNSGDLKWVKQISGAGYEYGHSIALDSGGNIYTAGFCEGTTDLDPGSGTFNFPDTVWQTVFVLKLDILGNFVWAKQLGGEIAVSMTVDKSGNIYTTGYFDGTYDFDPGPGQLNFTGLGYGDIYISKLTASGDMAWAKHIGGPGNDRAESIIVDGVGNVYLTGHFGETADFDPGQGIYNMTAPGVSVWSANIFILKLNTKGQMVWAENVGGKGYDVGTSLIADKSGNIYTTGYFTDTIDFKSGIGSISTGTSYNDVFVLKLGQPTVEIEDRLVNHLTIYPNPSNGTVYVTAAKDFNLTITDISGQILATMHNSSEINLPKGIYIFCFSIEDASVFKRVIVL